MLGDLGFVGTFQGSLWMPRNFTGRKTGLVRIPKNRLDFNEVQWIMLVTSTQGTATPGRECRVAPKREKGAPTNRVPARFGKSLIPRFGKDLHVQAERWASLYESGWHPFSTLLGGTLLEPSMKRLPFRAPRLVDSSTHLKDGFHRTKTPDKEFRGCTASLRFHRMQITLKLFYNIYLQNMSITSICRSDNEFDLFLKFI